MEKLIPIIWEWRFVIVAVVMVAIYAIVEWKIVKKLLTENIIKARQLAKDFVLESGQEQEDWVVEKVYDIMPVSVRAMMTPFGGKAILRKLVKIVYYKMKDYLDNQKFDNSWQEY